MKKFDKVNPKQNFKEMENKILDFWKKEKIFEESIESRPQDKPYRFYDGPPFITGTPHYGSLLSSICKDVVPRYQTMQGKRCERIWGWDCHGLPIEEKVQSKFGLSSNKEIEKIGVKKFIEECYTYTKETSAERERYIDHIGRWVDMDNAYRTMDQDYMESVMRVFKQLREKGLIYKGQRCSLYSWKLSTPISNFEVAMDNSYEEVQDPAITVMFPLTQDGKNVKKGDNILAWTTTPWTIPAHMCIGVNKELQYARVESEGKIYILVEARVETVFKNKEYEILSTFSGDELLGLKYEAPFNFYQSIVDESKNFIILDADFVTDTDGTGIAHQAPEFGDVDFQLAQKEGVYISNALDNEGKYTNQISDYKGTHYQQANNIITEKLKELGKLFKKESITHRVAFCPRSGTPLIYKVQDSWFIDIQKIKNKLIEENENINWYPKFLKHGQFLKSMEQAPDWCISRTRYWGTPMPIWKNSNNEIVVVGGRDEILEKNKLFGQIAKNDGKYYFNHGTFEGKEFNLHKPYIDEILLVNEKGIKAKNVLGVHGWKSRGLKAGIDNFWGGTKDLLEKENINLQVPDFDKSEETSYEKRKQTFDALNIEENFDTIIAHSLGCFMTMEYILEKEIKLKRLVLVAPSGLKGNTVLEKMENQFSQDKSKLKNLVDEIVILHSKDDTSKSAGFEYGEKLAKIINATLVAVDGYDHSFAGCGKNIVSTIVAYGEPFQRTTEVLDVWMDSGSMPYAQMHYPFERKQQMEDSYPADFIVEYIGQVRAWFYVMHVIGVALFDKRSYTNVITTGIVNGNDGRKMSKSYKNYPDPRTTIDKYGADSIRFYMFNSPLMHGGNMSFKEEGVEEVMRKVLLPIWNTYSFFVTYANIDNFEPTGKLDSSNKLDQWILSELNQLIKDITIAMDEYKINEATKPLVDFMENLTNRYIRRSRKRFWKSENDKDKMQAYETLYFVLTKLSQVMAPFTPFIAENIYRNLTGERSVHLTDWPTFKENKINKELNQQMNVAQIIVSLGLSRRARNKIRTRQPLSSVQITENLPQYYQEIIKEELNVKNVIISQELAKEIAKPEGRIIGPKYGKQVQEIIKQAKEGNFTKLDEGKISISIANGDIVLEENEYTIEYVSADETLDLEAGSGVVVSLDKEINDDLLKEGYARDLVRYIQEARKQADYNVADRILVAIQCSDFVLQVVELFREYIETETLSKITDLEYTDIQQELMLGDEPIILSLKNNENL